MKYFAPFFAVIASLLILAPAEVNAQTMSSRTSGHILLQVEEHGEAWYVDPVREERIYVQNGEAAYQIMRELGLGISNSDLDLIPVGLTSYETWDRDADMLYSTLEESIGTDPYVQDTDGDGFSDYEEILNGFDPLGPGMKEIDQELTHRLLGRIVLQVEEKGQAWYIHPTSGKRYYLPNGDAAYAIMRELSTGITNQDLAMIQSFNLGSDCEEDLTCFQERILQGLEASVDHTMILDLGEALLVTKQTYQQGYKMSNGKYLFKIITNSQYLNGEAVEIAEGLVQECLHGNLEKAAEAVAHWESGDISGDELAFAVCEEYHQ